MDIPEIVNDSPPSKITENNDRVDSIQVMDDDEEEEESCTSDINLLKVPGENQSEISNENQLEGPSEDQQKVLDDVVQQQRDELDYYQRQLAINEHKYLTDVSDLRSQLQSSKKMYDTAKHEKEAAFMRYVLKEKEILDLNTEKKKLIDSLKDKDKQIARLKANCKDVASFTTVIETKNKEIKEYKVIIDLLKDDKSKISKDLDFWKTKYEHESKCSHETESKLLHEIQELQNRLESLTKQNESFNEESNLEKIILNSKMYLDLKKFSEQQLQEMNKLKSVIEELNNNFTKCTYTVNSLENENIDLKTYMKSCEIKTNELLMFTESLSSRNASLQSECLNLQTTLDKLKSDCDILKQKNNDLKIAFKSQEDSIAKEKELYDCDKKELASHLAHKMQMIADLKTTLERTQDDLHVSKRKYKTTVSELTKELQKKNIVDTSVEMKMVLDKMVKLQQENARICEKLDFVEDHNKHLLCELKKKSSIMQKHGISGGKNGLVSSLNEKKPERY
ncbi:coiled-coil domain-containing protein 186-like [Rhopalosiphum maidis]|uniref:coiled-coil domain-containing protein 186-like n=1 Tax=Rhopalosiphum maidis TaxID=43146 RepID=UPI000EFE541F|nr:coiled-coil domain-containing protein 186-like [Rhopalosiphum maidis]